MFSLETKSAGQNRFEKADQLMLQIIGSKYGGRETVPVG